MADEERTSEGLRVWIDRNQPLHIEGTVGNKFFKKVFQRTGTETLLLEDGEGTWLRVEPASEEEK
jgi:hypothetical protein